MRDSVFETILGAVVVIAAAVFLWYALSQTESSGSGGTYDLTARFNSVIGVQRGTDVRLAGVKVGSVTDIEIDAERFEAVVTLAMDDGIELPEDSDAKVSTDGLLGGSYLAVEPGGSFAMIPTDGSGEIIYTRGSVDLLTLFASFASGGGGSDAGSSTPAPASADPVPDEQ